jgi:protein-disulfide isomerase
MSRTKTVVNQPGSAPNNNRTMLLAGVGGIAVLLIVVLIAISQGWIGATEVNSGDEVASLDSQGMIIGNEDATILIREFADFRCPHCKDAAATLTPQIIENYVNTGLVRFQYTPVAVINNESTYAAQAAMCAEDQNKFWSYHDVLFDRQGRDLFSIENLSAWAGEEGMDETQFRNCLVSGEYLDELNANQRDFQASGGTGTPTFLVGGQLLNGVVGWDEMKTAIDQQLAAAGGDVAPAAE